jgi:hypothetical protein
VKQPLWRRGVRPWSLGVEGVAVGEGSRARVPRSRWHVYLDVIVLTCPTCALAIMGLPMVESELAVVKAIRSGNGDIRSLYQFQILVGLCSYRD